MSNFNSKFSYKPFGVYVTKYISQMRLGTKVLISQSKDEKFLHNLI